MWDPLWGKAGRGRKTTLESKAYSKSKNPCLPSPHFARLCWQVVISWHWPVVLGYLVSLLAFPHGDTFLLCSASCHPMKRRPVWCVPPCPWPLLFSFVLFTPPTPWLSALGGRQNTLPTAWCLGGVLVFCLSFQTSAEFLKADAGSYSPLSPKVST